MRFLRALWKDDRGQDMLEYALIVAFIASASGACMPAANATASYLSRTMQVLSSEVSQIASY